MNNMIEEVEFNEEELEGISFNVRSWFDFPTITVGYPLMYLNAKSASIVEADAYYKAYKTPEYIVLKKCSQGTAGAVKMVHHRSRFSCSSSAIIKNAQIKQGVYKLYKCKDGVCFKRYERLMERDA